MPSRMDTGAEASPEASFYFPEPSTVNPSATQALPSPPTVTSNVGRMYPGMHQQAAKAQAQQRQQQMMQQQQQQQRQAPNKQQRAKGTPPTETRLGYEVWRVCDGSMCMDTHWKRNVPESAVQLAKRCCNFCCCCCCRCRRWHVRSPSPHHLQVQEVQELTICRVWLQVSFRRGARRARVSRCARER